MATDHLRPWQFKPGESGNPNGRPKRLTLEELIENALDEPVKTEPGMTRREALAEGFVQELLQSEPWAVKLYLSRAWPETAKHQITGPRGGAIVFNAPAPQLIEDPDRLLNIAGILKELKVFDDPKAEIEPGADVEV